MNRTNVYLLVLAGESEAAQRFVTGRYPGHPINLVSKRDLREGNWKARIRQLRAMRGEALVIFSSSLADLREPLLLLCSGFMHRCRETVLADSDGRSRVCKRPQLPTLLPSILLSTVLDFLVLVATWAGSHVLSLCRGKQRELKPLVPNGLDIALLDPFFEPITAGGALSYLDGTLSGMLKASATCQVFSGRRLPLEYYPVQVISSRRRLYLFRECQSLSYNLRFALQVWRSIRRRKPRILYQRHGRHVLAGALLSWLTRIPLVLEYQSSEVWLANNWDPARFRTWIALCEEVSIAASSQIVVLSEALRDELLKRGYPAERIILNPAAVNPERFRPDCGGKQIRRQLGVAPYHTVVTFVGTFSYYHGIPVLARAITALLKRRGEEPALANLRFMLVGDGLLRPETEEALNNLEGPRAVIFTGLIPHASVPSYLDASDILVSPQIPNDDGQPFFGSPTKLFEYMAMEKAIVASDMDQLSRVLNHRTTAWLVTPGSDTELANAIESLAAKPKLRRLLGRSARATALEHHTWHQNAVRFLSQTGLSGVSIHGQGVPSISSIPQRDNLTFEATGERD